MVVRSKVTGPTMRDLNRCAALRVMNDELAPESKKSVAESFTPLTLALWIANTTLPALPDLLELHVAVARLESTLPSTGVRVA